MTNLQKLIFQGPIGLNGEKGEKGDIGTIPPARLMLQRRNGEQSILLDRNRLSSVVRQFPELRGPPGMPGEFKYHKLWKIELVKLFFITLRSYRSKRTTWSSRNAWITWS